MTKLGKSLLTRSLDSVMIFVSYSTKTHAKIFVLAPICAGLWPGTIYITPLRGCLLYLKAISLMTKPSLLKTGLYICFIVTANTSTIYV